ncbi:7130_t:CDS:2 [Gigaspora margarita]|uniref:7130_t:CDS:1 n=1 Tax=Gigaspora margarita TaxID=4874 RepID=A0ABN7V9J8_GIGMA|nr:7130_t:CDS:2 [Gigaspora margarita]
MANESNKNIFDSIFSETHHELEILNNEISQLQNIYLTDYNSDEESDNETNEFIIDKTSDETSDQTSKSIALAVYINNFFTIDQIKSFHKMYMLNPMRAIMEENKAREKRLDKHNDDAFLIKLQQSCCAKSCFLNVNNQAALKRFQEMKAMTQYESSLCFLGIIDASMHVTEFKNGKPKTYLTTDYKFEGVTICQKAWYTIYDIQKRRWEALRTHYQNFGLTPKIHGLTGRVSNYAISFSTTLNVLHFIANFANQHGLPSPGCSFRDNTREIIYLPACESKRSLYRIYNDLEHDGVNDVSLSSFLRIWKRYLPGIQFLTARSDLCMLCKKRRFGVKYWNASEVLQKLNEWTDHYNWACLEHENYR